MNATIRFENCPSVPARFHELAEIFPWLEGTALDALRDDIRKHGVREPVVFLDDAILDGRNRYMCARDLGIEYPRRDFGTDPADGDDPRAFVVSINLHRRHLTESQRASVAARLANLHLGANQHVQASANLRTLPLSELAKPSPPMISQAEAARMLNVSPRAVTTAKKVQEEAPREIIKAVDDGRISVSLAAQIVDLPDEDKAEIAAAAPDEIRDVAREVVKKAFVANNSGNNEWYTPAEYIAAAREVMGRIDLDPASNPLANETVGATIYYTAETDGLAQEWPRGNIWMNPPYATGLVGKFINRFASEILAGSTGIVLVNNATETAWFQELAGVSSAICFPKSRIRFIDQQGKPSGAPLQGQAVFYAGSDPDRFAAVFSKFGVVLRHG